MKDVALIHILSWGCDVSRFEIIPGISIYETEDTYVKHLYLQECQKGLDSGEPYDFNVAIEIDYTKIDYSGTSFYSPLDEGTQLITVLSICLGTAFGLIRTIKYFDDEKGILETNVISEYGEQRSFIIGRHIIFDEDLPIINKIFTNVFNIWRRDKANSQIINALTYFYFARDMHFIEQTAINLAITLECLFSPHSQSEITHQIAYNISLFLEGTKTKRISNYKLIKRFYRLRSGAVHGGKLIDKDKDIDIISNVFNITANILKKILYDSELINIFNNTDKRKKYLEDLIFP